MQYNSHVPIQHNSHVPIQHNSHVTIQYNSHVPIQYTTFTFQYNATVTFQCNTTVTFQCIATITGCELVSSIRYKLTRAYSEDSNQFVHPLSLIRVLVFHLKKCFGLLATHIVPIVDSDQTARMRRLICVVDGCTCQLVPFTGNTVILLDKSFLPFQTAS